LEAGTTLPPVTTNNGTRERKKEGGWLERGFSLPRGKRMCHSGKKKETQPKHSTRRGFGGKKKM